MLEKEEHSLEYVFFDIGISLILLRNVNSDVQLHNDGELLFFLPLLCFVILRVFVIQ